MTDTPTIPDQPEAVAPDETVEQTDGVGDVPTEPVPPDKTEDAGQAEVQERMDEATEKGFFGAKVDPLPNEDHSLESGPDAPSLVPDDQTRA